MTSQTVIWTALPHGTRQDGRTTLRRLSVFVSPRLFTDGPAALDLALFPDFADWTGRNPLSIGFGVWVRTSAGERRVAVARPVPGELWPEGWRALFDGAVVSSFRPDDMTDRAHATYDAVALHDEIMGQYQQSAALGLADRPAPPPVPEGDLDGQRAMIRAAAARVGEPLRWSAPDGRRFRLLSQAAALDRARERFRARRSATASTIADRPHRAIRVAPIVPDLDEDDGDQGAAAEIAAAAPPLAYQLAHFVAFHGHAAAPRPPRSRRQDRQVEHEFHDILARVGGHPVLLRRFGLVLPLEFAEEIEPGSGTAWIRVEPVSGWQPETTTAPPGSPWTAFDLGTFRPVPRAHRAVGPAIFATPGFVVSPTTGETGRLDLMQVDLEGAALKNPLVLESVASRSAGDDGPVPRTAGRLPFLRGGGLSIIRRHQSELLAASFEAARDHDARLTRQIEGRVTPDDALGAEDLTRGYRIDILDAQTQRWFSLHERSVAYRLRGRRLEWAASDRQTGEIAEGLTQLGVTVAGGGDPPLLLVNETLTRWDGWSLSVPRPGRSVGDAGAAAPIVAPVDTPGIGVEQRVGDGSLPRLRYGGRYRLRVRSVDMAGNSLSLAEAATAGLAVALPRGPDPFTYRRFEPVTSPILLVRQAFALGDAPDTIVLRSGFMVDATTYAQQHAEFARSPERVVAPPRAAQAIVEQCGNLDASFGPDPAAQARTGETYELGARDTAAFGARDRAGNPAEVGTAAAETVPTTVPYLPDPYAVGAAFRFRDGESPMQSGVWAATNDQGLLVYGQVPQVRDAVVRIAFAPPGDAWPTRRPFRVRLVEADPFARPAWDARQRVLSIGLPQGERIVVALSSGLAGGQDDFRKLGMWQWLLDLVRAHGHAGCSLDPAVCAVIQRFTESGLGETWRRRAAAGEVWFLTPAREISLVHAVQQPAERPTVNRFVARRELGETFVGIENRLGLHAKSTAKLELLAAWSEPVDRLDEKTWRSVATSTRVAEQHVLPPSGRGDESDLPASWANKSVLELIPGGARERNGRRVLVSGARAGDQAAAPAPLQHQFGDTKHRTVTYRLLATSRFPEFFPPGSDLTLESDPIAPLPVPSSARPVPPTVGSAIPAFRWQHAGDATATRLRERWGGVRVYLERPWFSSGEGERLGVVLWAPPGGSWPPPAPVEPLVSRWGIDPIWRTDRDRPEPLTLDRFLARIADESRAGLSLPGFEGPDPVGTGFAVAAHEVTYDTTRRLWFADIQIDASPHYFPFVRLALARYQPDSIVDAHLSAVVAADVVQIAPYRSVALTPTAGDPDLLTISLAGPVAGESLSAEAAEPAFGPFHGPNEVAVRLEKRLPGTDDDLGWIGTAWPGLVPEAPDLGPGELWRRRVRLPADRPQGAYRLVIQEFELLSGDDPAAGYPPERRLVYAETIVL